MLLAALLWTLAVALVWWLADVILGILTPSTGWLEANPDLAAFLSPLLGIVGTLGVSAAVIIWLIGIVLILLVGRLRPVSRLRERFGRRERWHEDDDRSYRPYRSERSYERDEWCGREDDRDDDRWRDRGRWKRRKRRDDDDDDDDDD